MKVRERKLHTVSRDSNPDRPESTRVRFGSENLQQGCTCQGPICFEGAWEQIVNETNEALGEVRAVAAAPVIRRSPFSETPDRRSAARTNTKGGNATAADCTDWDHLIPQQFHGILRANGYFFACIPGRALESNLTVPPKATLPFGGDGLKRDSVGYIL